MSRRWHHDINATLELLNERFPRTFFMLQQRRRPLKVGIRMLGQALHVYTHNLFYRRAQKQGVPRIDLNGEVAGTVSEADALSAALMTSLAARKPVQAVFKLTPAPTPTPPQPPPEPPQPPKRLSLADLRTAALRRKAVEAGGDQTLDRVDVLPAVTLNQRPRRF